MQNHSHEPVFRSTASFAGGPARPEDIGRLTVDAVRRVHPKLSINLLVYSRGAEMGVKLSYLGTDVAPDQKVRWDGIAGSVSRFEHGVELAEGEEVIGAQRCA